MIDEEQFDRGIDNKQLGQMQIILMTNENIPKCS